MLKIPIKLFGDKMLPKTQTNVHLKISKQPIKIDCLCVCVFFLQKKTRKQTNKQNDIDLNDFYCPFFSQIELVRRRSKVKCVHNDKCERLNSNKK